MTDGILLWGQATGDRKLRDLGVYLFTTELAAIEEYWFDVHDENHPPSYSPSVVTMIWGGKGANGTWFSANPEMVHGINWLPLHGGSLYLGRFPEYVDKNYRALLAENSGPSWDAWADLVWMYRALSNPQDARAQFEAGANHILAEEGNAPGYGENWPSARRYLPSYRTPGAGPPTSHRVRDKKVNRRCEEAHRWNRYQNDHQGCFSRPFTTPVAAHLA